MPHQDETLHATWNLTAWALFLEMGLGKTKLALDTALMLWDRGKITGMLVVAPKGAYLTWGKIEIPKLMPDIPYQAATWSAGMSATNTEKVNWVCMPNKGVFKILIMNVEGLITKQGIQTARTFLKAHFALWILDESTTIKNPKAKRSMAIIDLSRQAPYRRIMSGAPVNKEPADLYNQLMFLEDSPLGFKSWYAFRNCFQIMKPMAIGSRIIQTSIGTQNEEVLNHRLKSISTRYTKKDCLKDLPPKTYVQRIVPLTGPQKKIYEELRHNAFALLNEHDLVTYTLVVVEIVKLQQVVCGFVFPDQNKPAVDIPSNRIETVLELLEEHDGKAVIWARHQHSVEALTRAIKTEFGRFSAASYYGETSDKERARILEEFQDPKSPLRYFIGNQATGKFALTLTEARLCIYFSNSFDLEERRQSEDRLHRAGQKSAVTYIDLITPNTVDEKILKNLMNKTKMSASIMGDQWHDWLT
jgi:SNF2 family DNA or RNA helicase